MKIRLLDSEEVTEIYREKMPGDFAAGEIKPLKRILELSKQGRYFCYGIFETGKGGEEMVSYCFLVTSEKKDAVLLDYFAVGNKLRGKGYGSRCFAMLKEKIKNHNLGNLILEVENPGFGADEKERELRRRRIAFYIRNGMTLTHLRIFLYQVEYLVMTCDQKQMLKTAEQIYHVYEVLLKPDKIKTRLNISSNIRCVFMSPDMDIAMKGAVKGIVQKEILTADSPKGSHGGERLEGFQGLIEKNGIEPEECLVFGCSDEDVGLLQYAGVGIATENASNAAKNAANYVMEPEKQGTVLRVMEEILQIGS